MHYNTTLKEVKAYQVGDKYTGKLKPYEARNKLAGIKITLLRLKLNAFPSEPQKTRAINKMSHWFKDPEKYRIVEAIACIHLDNAGTIVSINY